MPGSHAQTVKTELSPSVLSLLQESKNKHTQKKEGDSNKNSSDHEKEISQDLTA